MAMSPSVCAGAARDAIDGSDADAARAATLQCALQLEGRARTLGGSFLACQAEAMRAIADAERLRAAVESFAHRDHLDWSLLWRAESPTTRCDLRRAARALGRADLDERIS